MTYELNEGARNVAIVCGVFAILATFTVIARFWSRRIKDTALALDDWLIVAGLACFYISTIHTLILVEKGGLGRHLGDGVSQDEPILTGKVSHHSTCSQILPL